MPGSALLCHDLHLFVCQFGFKATHTHVSGLGTDGPEAMGLRLLKIRPVGSYGAGGGLSPPNNSLRYDL